MKQQQSPAILKQQSRHINPNYEYYRGKSDNPLNPKITEFITSWQSLTDYSQFYQCLERDHSYIQWLFPNFFKSMFNPNSHALTLKERKQFLKSKKVMRQYFNNFLMQLRFFGITLKEQQLQLVDEEQFKNCCFKHMHNLMRMQRILASLSVLGHRNYAIQFCEFLKIQFKDKESVYNKLFVHYERVDEECDQKNQRPFEEFRRHYIPNEIQSDFSILSCISQ